MTDDSCSEVYSKGLFLLRLIIFSVLVVSIVVFACGDHPEKDSTPSEKKNKIKLKPTSTHVSDCGSTGSKIVCILVVLVVVTVEAAAIRGSASPLDMRSEIGRAHV